jgi:hypothetical protein
MSGGVSVNETLFHVAQHDMPFGGIGESGMGHYHGKGRLLNIFKTTPSILSSKNQWTAFRETSLVVYEFVASFSITLRWFWILNTQRQF